MGRLGVGEALAEPVLALGVGLGTKSQTQEEDTSVPLLSRASELLAGPGMPSSPATPTTQPSSHRHTFRFVCFSWGLPILEAGRLRLSQAEGQRGADPSPAQPLSVFTASWKDRAKSQRIEVRRSRTLGSGFPSWPLPAPRGWADRELPGEAQVSGEVKGP